MREIRELWMPSSPPLQRIAIDKILTRKLEVLLNFICERLRKVSVARYEINLLQRAVHCGGWCHRSCGGWAWFVVFGTEMGMKAFFGGFKVDSGVRIITTVCEKAAIWYPRN
jgi:hypothetical protein